MALSWASFSSLVTSFISSSSTTNWKETKLFSTVPNSFLYISSLIFLPSKHWLKRTEKRINPTSRCFPGILRRSCFHFIPLSKRKIISLSASRELIPCHMHATSYLYDFIYLFSFCMYLILFVWISLLASIFSLFARKMTQGPNGFCTWGNYFRERTTSL